MVLIDSEITHKKCSAVVEFIVGPERKQRGFSIGPEYEEVKLEGEKRSGRISVKSIRSRGLTPRPLPRRLGNALVRLKRSGTTQKGIKTWEVLQQATLRSGLPGTGNPIKVFLAEGKGVGDGTTQLAVDGKTVFADISIRPGNSLILCTSQEADGTVVIREI